MADFSKFSEGFVFAAGATVAVVVTLGALAAITGGWGPAQGANARAFRVSPINPDLNYSTIKGLVATRNSNIGVRTL